MTLFRSAGRLAVPATLVLLAVALLLDAAAAVFAMPITKHHPGWDGDSVLPVRPEMYETALVLIGLAVMLLGLAVPVARGSRLAGAGIFPVLGLWVLWSIIDWTSPWAARGRWSDGPGGQFDWSGVEAATRHWYPPVSHLLFGLEVAAAVAAVLLLLARLGRRAPATAAS
ncbi:hypothetical protein Lfu02_16000 [Longispora fulva]|uniref:Uncharacterized protein n=1 Tax=Longispora fulva TaxID=619741 RepID=A0A8J7KNL7_9ACTN|nr:hypothetical protein [Longispora fulva]MBG6140391.1 hypothetical protein [Longispora fulva]GIG57228.1 hypothetical protein Lfu02_16000 [Longispora fulva]